MSQSQDPQPVHTAGGAAITGDVNTGGGDFVGRDFIQDIRDHVTIIGDDNFVGDGNAVIQVRGDVCLIQIGERVGRLTPQTLRHILTSALAMDEPLHVYANPYRGLKPFTTEDAELFFGRDALVAEMLAQLRRAPRFLAVVGPSGSGKSSVVQAGLLPALQRGALSGSQSWQIVTTRPGADPYVSVDLSSFLKPDRSERIVLFLDQFEELFALCAPEVQQHFLEDLHALISGPIPVTVILALRADFYGHLQRSPLGALLKQALVDVLPLTPAELRATVEEPACQVGLAFEAGLVERIVDDARQAEHALPLLQSALAQVCHRQENGRLTYAAYQTVGGVAGALGLWAEDAYTALTADEQILARRIFTRLVHFHTGEGADTRQRQSLGVLAARPVERDAVHRLVRRLADARLLVTAEHEGEQTVEIIHDALLREWGRLADWLTEQREFYLWRQRLDGQLQTWEAQGCDESALLRGALLVEAEGWAASHSADLNTPEHRFIEACLTLREQERAARERRRRRLTLATIGAAVVFLVLALLAWGQRNSALDSQATAEAEAQYRATAQAETEVQRLEAVNARATAEARLIEAVNAQATAEARRIEAEEAQTVAETHRIEADDARLEVEREARISRARELAALALAADDPTGSLNLMLAREAAMTTWLTDTAVITIPFITDEAIAALQFAIYNAQHLPGRMTIKAHAGSVYAVAYSPDGIRIVSGGEDQIIRVWDTQTGYEQAQFFGHTGPVYAVSYSPDGKRIVSGSQDQTVRIWDAENGEELVQFVGHTGPVNTVMYNSNGTQIASGSDDQTIRIWDTETGIELARYDIHTNEDYYISGRVISLDYSPDERYIVSGGDGEIHVWDTQAGTELTQLKYDAGMGYRYTPVQTVVYSPDGLRLISSGSDSAIRVWDTGSWAELARFNIPNTYDLCVIDYSPNSQHILIGSSSGEIYVYNTESEEELAQLSGHSGFINTVAYSPDGMYAVSGGEDGTIRIWDMTAFVVLQAQKDYIRFSGHQGLVYSVAYSPNKRQVASGGEDRTLRIWDLQLNKEVSRFADSGHRSSVIALDFSPDGRQIVNGSGDWLVNVWNLETETLYSRFYGHMQGVTGVVYSFDGRRIVSTSLDQTARVWNIQGGDVYAHDFEFLPVEDSANVQNTKTYYADFGPMLRTSNSIYVVGRDYDGILHIWDVETGSEFAQFANLTEHVLEVLSSDGIRIIYQSKNGALSMWDVASANQLAQFIGHIGQVNATVYAEDMKRLISAGDDHTIRVWDVQTGDELFQLIGHTGPVIDLALHPDGTHVVSGSYDGTVRVWNISMIDKLSRDAERVNLCTGHPGWVHILEYDPNGQHSIIVSDSKTHQMFFEDVDYLLRLANCLIQCSPPIFTVNERALFGFDDWPAIEH